jgi:hypothetical protein
VARNPLAARTVCFGENNHMAVGRSRRYEVMLLCSANQPAIEDDAIDSPYRAFNFLRVSSSV